MTLIIIYIRYNGEVTYGDEGLQFQGQHAKSKFIWLNHRISRFSKLKKKICSALELNHHLHAMTITYRCPHIILAHNAKFIPISITCDDEVNLIFDMKNVWPQVIVIELYIVVEPLTQHDVEDLQQTLSMSDYHDVIQPPQHCFMIYKHQRRNVVPIDDDEV